ncbi:hypothetical protein AB0C81_04160 [Streptomyces roseoverticillatus]|uniref:hypothetical protein n=1 Tax=Streptomyces roseoverticillatus TaxID=66429 RepID=UPI0034013D4C
MPARWDDPPASLSEDDLMRMAPGGRDDELLNAVSDALWEPIELNETPSAGTERIKRIAERGEKLREQWAETAALEEAYAAPPTTLHERQRSARHKNELIEDRVRRSRRLRLLMVMASSACTVFMLGLWGVFLVHGGTHVFTFPMAIIAGMVPNIASILWTWLSLREGTKVRVVIPHRRTRESHGSEEAPAKTPE